MNLWAMKKLKNNRLGLGDSSLLSIGLIHIATSQPDYRIVKATLRVRRKLVCNH